jgi:hypothetical protein
VIIGVKHLFDVLVDSFNLVLTDWTTQLFEKLIDLICKILISSQSWFLNLSCFLIFISKILIDSTIYLQI